MMEYFGAAWASADVEGIFLGRGAGKKYRVQWISLPDKPTLEYGGRYSVFKDPTASMCPAADDTRISNPAEPAAKRPRNGASSSQGPLKIHSEYDTGDDMSEQSDSEHIDGSDLLTVKGNVWREEPGLDCYDCREG